MNSDIRFKCHTNVWPSGRTIVGFHVIGLVGPQRRPLIKAFAQFDRRIPLARAARMCHRAIDHKPIAVLHQRVPQIGQPALLTIGLAVKPRIRIRRRGMCLVRSLLAVEITLAVAAGLPPKLLTAGCPRYFARRAADLKKLCACGLA